MYDRARLGSTAHRAGDVQTGMYIKRASSAPTSGGSSGRLVKCDAARLSTSLIDFNRIQVLLWSDKVNFTEKHEISEDDVELFRIYVVDLAEVSRSNEPW